MTMLEQARRCSFGLTKTLLQVCLWCTYGFPYLILFGYKMVIEFVQTTVKRLVRFAVVCAMYPFVGHAH